MDSPLKVNAKAVREEAIKRAEEDFKYAKNTQEKHDARRALQRAKRAAAKV